VPAKPTVIQMPRSFNSPVTVEFAFQFALNDARGLEGLFGCQLPGIGSMMEGTSAERRQTTMVVAKTEPV
jgi:hypothetical protein